MKKLLSMAAGGLALLASFSAFSADYLIDMRTPAEFSEGHLKGALNIEYQNILNGAEALNISRETDTIRVYCRSGHRAGIALETLRNAGFRNVENLGGFEKLAETMPVEK